MASSDKYVLEVEGRILPIASVEELVAQIEELREQSSWCAVLSQQADDETTSFEKVLYGLLGLTSSLPRRAAHILAKGELATVVFLDEDSNEYRVVGGPDEVHCGDRAIVEFSTPDGISRHSIEECMKPAEAILAIAYWYEHGERPVWLTYQPGT